MSQSPEPEEAFVAGAKWCEFKLHGATMWQSDQIAAYEAALEWLAWLEKKDSRPSQSPEGEA